MITKNKLITATILLVLIIAIAILGSGIIRQSRLDESSREFAIRVIPAILSGNPRNEAQGDLEDAPQLEDTPTAAETFATFAHLSLLELRPMHVLDRYLYTVTQNLGPLEVVESISGGSEVPLLVFDSQIPSAAYVVDVVFSGGTAQVEIDMLLDQGEWQLTDFSVESELLAD